MTCCVNVGHCNCPDRLDVVVIPKQLIDTCWLNEDCIAGRGHEGDCRFPSYMVDVEISELRREIAALTARAEAAEAAVERVRALADEGFWLVRQYGDACETCGTQWQATGWSPEAVIGRPEGEA